VLEHGVIVERGNHAQLIAHNGSYAQMWARQQARQDEVPGSPGAEDGDAQRDELSVG
jgi:ATP-binding cassette subfamily B protein